MSSRRTALKLALLSIPLAAGAASLYAFGEPAGRAARKGWAVASFPAHDHGAFRIRVRRGSDYHDAVARTLETFVRSVDLPAGPRATMTTSVLILDTESDLERFGLPPAKLDRGGMSDPATSTIALVGEGRTHHPEQDARTLRREMARLLFSRIPSPWLVEGLAAHFESAPPGATEGGRLGADDLLALPILLASPAGNFRGPGSLRHVESARLLVGFLLQAERGELVTLLQGRTPGILEDQPELEIRWREWARRPK